jgi:hypothetical protein
VLGAFRAEALGALAVLEATRGNATVETEAREAITLQRRAPELGGHYATIGNQEHP